MAIRDIASNYSTTLANASATIGTTAVNGGSLDHSVGRAAQYIFDASAWGSNVTLDLEFSADNVTFAAATAGLDNDVQVIATATGLTLLNVPNPELRYSRVVMTGAGASAATASLIAVQEKDVVAVVDN